MSLSLKTMKLEGDRDLVRMLAYWSTVGTWITWRLFSINFSLTKNKSSSICLVLECRTGLWAWETVLILSQKITGVVCLTFNSNSKVWIQVTSVEARARLLYPASVLDLAKTFCFFDHQNTRLGPKQISALEVDSISSRSEAQSASQHAWTEKLDSLEGCSLNPSVKVLFRYLRILFTACQCYINWHTLFIEKHISGLIIVAYCSAPTTNL